MKLFLEIDDSTGAVRRITCVCKGKTGIPVGVDMQATPDAPLDVPPHLMAAVAWAQAAVTAAKQKHLESTLEEFGGVPPEKVAATVAAIEAEKAKPAGDPK